MRTTTGVTAGIEFPPLQELTFEVLEGDIGVLRINRPDRMNS